MAIVSMADAVAGQVAIASEYNKLIDNILDLDARLGPVSLPDDVSARLTVLEQRTLNTSGNVGIGNQRLSDRLGSGVSNTTNVTTGTATAQLTDIRTRLSAVEASVTGGGPVCQLRQTVVQNNFANGTPVAVLWDTEDIDTHNGHSTASNTSRFTVPSGWAGWYEVSGGLYFDSTSTTGGRIALLRKNGAEVPGGWGPAMPGSVGQGALLRTMLIQLAVGDYIEMYGRWAGGGTVALNLTTEFQPTFTIRWLKP